MNRLEDKFTNIPQAAHIITPKPEAKSMKSQTSPPFERLSPTSEEYKQNDNIRRRTPAARTLLSTLNAQDAKEEEMMNNNNNTINDVNDRSFTSNDENINNNINNNNSPIIRNNMVHFISAGNSVINGDICSNCGRYNNHNNNSGNTSSCSCSCSYCNHQNGNNMSNLSNTLSGCENHNDLIINNPSVTKSYPPPNRKSSLDDYKLNNINNINSNINPAASSTVLLNRRSGSYGDYNDMCLTPNSSPTNSSCSVSSSSNYESNSSVMNTASVLNSVSINSSVPAPQYTTSPNTSPMMHPFTNTQSIINSTSNSVNGLIGYSLQQQQQPTPLSLSASGSITTNTNTSINTSANTSLKQQQQQQQSQSQQPQYIYRSSIPSPSPSLPTNNNTPSPPLTSINQQPQPSPPPPPPPQQQQQQQQQISPDMVYYTDYNGYYPISEESYYGSYPGGYAYIPVLPQPALVAMPFIGALPPPLIPLSQQPQQQPPLPPPLQPPPQQQQLPSQQQHIPNQMNYQHSNNNITIPSPSLSPSTSSSFYSTDNNNNLSTNIQKSQSNITPSTTTSTTTTSNSNSTPLLYSNVVAGKINNNNSNVHHHPVISTTNLLPGSSPPTLSNNNNNNRMLTPDTTSSGNSNSNNNNNNNMKYNSQSCRNQPSTLKPILNERSNYGNGINNNNNSNNKPNSTKAKKVKFSTKNFSSEFKELQEEYDYNNVLIKVKSKIQQYPSDYLYKIYCEIADYCKRENQFEDAKNYFETSIKYNPNSYTAWLEYIKMEEELGKYEECNNIIIRGIQQCEDNENILIKGLKLFDRIKDYSVLQELLQYIPQIGSEQCWRCIVEGGLVEAKLGHYNRTRKIFTFLLHNFNWLNQIYNDYVEFEERLLNIDIANDISTTGITKIPLYGPLWFSAIRIKYKLEYNVKDVNNSDCPYLELTQLPSTMSLYEEALNNIPNELSWKLYYEKARMDEYIYRSILYNIQQQQQQQQTYNNSSSDNNNRILEFRYFEKHILSRIRKSYLRSICYCNSDSLKWKILQGGARTEMIFNNYNNAIKLIKRSLNDSPSKSRSLILIDQSRIEELNGNTYECFNILNNEVKLTSCEWKLYYELITFYMRRNNKKLALETCKDALKIHMGSGRLWSLYIELNNENIYKQFEYVRNAINIVPKSGEVWCAAARLHMNPNNLYFDPITAQKYLEYAVLFTPQCGDSFLECLRLTMILQLSTISTEVENCENKSYIKSLVRRFNTNGIEQQCLNSNPNYGALWFYFKEEYYDSPLNVLENAKNALIETLTEKCHDYINALNRYFGLPSKPLKKVDVPEQIELFPGLSSFVIKPLPPYEKLPLKLQHKLLFDSDILTP